MLHQADYFTASTHHQPRVAAIVGCGDNLMALSWHTPISKSPFRYAIGIRDENCTHPLLLEHRSCTLNFLPFSHYESIDLFGKEHGGDKLSKTPLHATHRDCHNNLMLDESDMVFVCELIDTYENGDRTLFILDITQTYINDAIPSPTLFFGQGWYAPLGDSVRASKKHF
jgi:flavin reductase (DIM6/NTAB) family NADH-FMN oxidoreductase RutF